MKQDDIQRRSSNSYPTLPSLQPSRSLHSSMAMPTFSTYLPQQSLTPLKSEEEEEESAMSSSESSSLLPHDPLSSITRGNTTSMAPPLPAAGTRAVSSSYHLPQTQTQTQLNRLNPSMSYLPNSAAYSTSTIQRPSNSSSTTTNAADSALVEELVNENWRLNQEVESLHAIIAMSPHGTTASTALANTSILQNTNQYNPQTQFREPPPAGRVFGVTPSGHFPGGISNRSIAPYAVSTSSPTMYVSFLNSSFSLVIIFS